MDFIPRKIKMCILINSISALVKWITLEHKYSDDFNEMRNPKNVFFFLFGFEFNFVFRTEMDAKKWRYSLLGWY